MDPELGQLLIIGDRVVQTASGYTGEIYQMFPWGVQVWNPDRGNERENWSWAMITVRTPRLVKRYPRPFRWPREIPTEQCHCKIGRMEVEGEHEVRCTRCKKLVGSEAYPRRFLRASKLLRSAYSGRKSKKQTSPRVERSKRRKAPRARPKAKRDAHRVGVRHPRSRKARSGHDKNRKRSKGRKKVPKAPKGRSSSLPKGRQGQKA
jgi:hypothetical protein